MKSLYNYILLTAFYGRSASTKSNLNRLLLSRSKIASKRTFLQKVLFVTILV